VAGSKKVPAGAAAGRRCLVQALGASPRGTVTVPAILGELSTEVRQETDANVFYLGDLGRPRERGICSVAGRAVILADRRNPSPLGRRRRKSFEQSLNVLRALGLPSWVVRCYLRAARDTDRLPHEILCSMAEYVASTMLEVPSEDDGAETSTARLTRVAKQASPAAASKRSRLH